MENDPSEAFFQISSITNINKKYNFVNNSSKYVLKNGTNVANPEDSLRLLLEKALDDAALRARDLGQKDEYYYLKLDAAGLKKSINAPPRRRTANTVDAFLNRIKDVDQSNESVNLMQAVLNLTVMTMDRPENYNVEDDDQNGAGFVSSKHYLGVNEQGLIKIENENSLCLFYALELTRLFQIRDREGEISRQSYDRILKNKKRQETYATNLIQSCKISPIRKTFGLKDVRIVQQFYDRQYPGMYRIVVIKEGTLEPIFRGSRKRKYTIPIYFHQKHYDGIKKLHIFFNSQHYCVDCGKAFQQLEAHTSKCIAKCLHCLQIGPEYPCIRQDDFFIVCNNCNIEFFNKKCYDKHFSLACCRFSKCNKCTKIYAKRKGKHICYENYCKICKVNHDKNRSCFITPWKPPKSEAYRIVAFDYETTQETVIKDNIVEHLVNYASVHLTCTNCIDKMNKNCKICGQERIKEWNGSLNECKDPLGEMIEWLFNSTPTNIKTIAYAHNGSRFDFHLILRRLYKMNIIPNLTMAGMKIFQMDAKDNKNFPQVIFRDSYLIMSVPLGNLKKTFNLKCENKMFFPYLFNSVKNYNRRLSTLPPASDYIPDSMMPEKRKEFEKYYKKNFETPFYLPTKLSEYGLNDTEILLEAIIEMRRILKNIANYDVMEHASTIAGICMKIFRSKFLKKDQLSIVPENGHEREDNQSDEAIKYLTWFGEKYNVPVQHARNGGEKAIGKFKVDGYIENFKGAPLVVEYDGCTYHGCEQCFDDYHVCRNGKTSRFNIERSEKRIEEIRKTIPNVQVVKACDVKKLLNLDKEMKKYYEEMPNLHKINPRSAFTGGRTGPLSTHAYCREDEEIGVFDIVSLYPSINYDQEYPIGVPKIYKFANNIVNWTRSSQNPYKGLLLAKILPPKNTLIPALARKTPHGLLFASCYKCADYYNNKKNNRIFLNDYKCKHSDKEREYIDTFSHVDLNNALDNGYRVLQVYTVWHYEKWSNEIFKSYVTEFLKIKVLSSPLPFDNDEENLKFLKKYKEKYGIDMKLEDVKPNPGLRHIAKLCLNR